MGLMDGKRGLVMGVANERSIAWGIAKALAEAGAELAFTYQGEAFGSRLKPLAESVGSDFMVDVDVTDDASLDAAFEALTDPLVYPYFMAEGYFTGRILAPRSKARGLTQMRPFGVEPCLADCAEAELQTILNNKGWSAQDTGLLVAAHGSAVSRTSANSTYAMAATLHRRMGFLRTRVGLIEEPPHVEAMARGLGQAICLPFFALRAGHVVGDIPEALEAAGFTGPALPPIGEDRAVPALIAHALQAELAAAAAN